MDDDVMNLIETEIFEFERGHHFRTLPVDSSIDEFEEPGVQDMTNITLDRNEPRSKQSGPNL